jgi:phosphoribosylaminoimidazole-succinocarboxamide synthase
MTDAHYEITLPGVPLLKRGKVREVYDLGDSLLIVASDRISAFDSILPTPIPDKGRVLTQLSLFWFAHLRDVAPNHVIGADADAYPEELRPYAETLAGRSMQVKKAEVFPVECVVRGYLAGSGWAEYREQGTVCGIPLPEGLQEAAVLPEPIFTPSTKAENGHDEGISYERVVEMVGADTAAQLRDTSLELYRHARDHAQPRGVILADTKFEFGLVDGEVTLVDEVCTPDSSRFWPTEQYAPGSSPVSFDKQYVRDYLTHSGWDREPPAPPLPDDVVQRTRDKYLEALRILTST